MAAFRFGNGVTRTGLSASPEHGVRSNLRASRGRMFGTSVRFGPSVLNRLRGGAAEHVVRPGDHWLHSHEEVTVRGTIRTAAALAAVGLLVAACGSSTPSSSSSSTPSTSASARSEEHTLNSSHPSNSYAVF